MIFIEITFCLPTIYAVCRGELKRRERRVEEGNQRRKRERQAREWNEAEQKRRAAKAEEDTAKLARRLKASQELAVLFPGRPVLKVVPARPKRRKRPSGRLR